MKEVSVKNIESFFVLPFFLDYKFRSTNPNVHVRRSLPDTSRTSSGTSQTALGTSNGSPLVPSRRSNHLFLVYFQPTNNIYVHQLDFWTLRHPNHQKVSTQSPPPDSLQSYTESTSASSSTSFPKSLATMGVSTTVGGNRIGLAALCAA